MTREFEITEEMIRRGSPESDTTCPIGLALRAGGVDPLCVGYNFIECVEEGHRYVLPMPKAAFDFIRRYDAGEPVEPTSFKLTFFELPHPLPDRFKAKRTPQAPPLPIPIGTSSIPTFRKAFSRISSLFTF